MDWERTDSQWTNKDFSQFTYDTDEADISATVVSSLESNEVSLVNLQLSEKYLTFYSMPSTLRS